MRERRRHARRCCPTGGYSDLPLTRWSSRTAKPLASAGSFLMDGVATQESNRTGQGPRIAAAHAHHHLNLIEQIRRAWKVEAGGAPGLRRRSDAELGILPCAAAADTRAT